MDITKYEGHTEGPWHLFHEKHPGKRFTIAVLVDPKHGRPAIVDWPGFDATDLPRGQVVANARLIADAPALLAEVVRLRAEVRRLQAENARLRIPSIRRGRS